MVLDNFRKVRKILWFILFANIGVAAAKIVMGMMINSSSMQADGYHSLTDGTSNIIGLIGIWIAAKPVDSDHPYGHKKFETLTGLFIVGMLTYLGFRIITEAVSKFMKPVTPEITAESLIVMLITLCINVFVSKYEYRKGVALNSTILISDSMHTKSDVYVTTGVIATLVAIKLGAPPVIDPIASLIVACFILLAAFEILKSAGSILVDRCVVESEKVAKIVLAQSRVRGVHKIRSRGTLDDIHIDMHIQADAHLKLADSHRLCHEIEDALRKELNCNVQVIIHLEPYYEDRNLEKNKV